MLVKNFKTGLTVGPPSCSCNSWLQHWEKNIEFNDLYCRCCKKRFQKDDLVGGHVIKYDHWDENRYIVPLCYSCNSTYTTEPFDVPATDLVSANSSECKA